MNESDDELTALAVVASAVLGGSTTVGPLGPVRAGVTVYSDGRLLGSAVRRGVDRRAAVARAARRVRTDPRFTGARDLRRMLVSVWIPGDTVARAEFELGRDALIGAGADCRTYRPSIGLTRGYRDADAALRRLDPAGTARVERWRHVVLRPGTGRAIELHGLRPEPPVLTHDTVQSIVDRALDRLVATQQPDGAYRYVDHVFRSRRPRTPNLVRLAGTAYAVARASDAATGERRRVLTLSAVRAVHHLLGHAVELGGNLLVRTPDGTTPAGATALCLLAMQYGELTDLFGRERASMTAALLALQQRDGRFRGSPDSPSAQDEGNQQDYYPGETMLALIHEAERGDGQCWAAVAQGFAAHRDHFRARPRMAFALWQTDVWTRAWRLVGGPDGGEPGRRYADFVQEIGDHVAIRQRGRSADFEHRGGFARRGSAPGIASTCYVESLVHAYEVSEGYRDARRRYRRAVRAGLGFVARLQIDPLLAPMVRRPGAAVGGFTSSLTDFELRCDHDQHAVTMFLSAARHAALLEIAPTQ